MSSGRKERTKVNAKISLTYFQTGSLQKKKKNPAINEVSET